MNPLLQDLILTGAALVLAGASIGLGICVNILLEHWYYNRNKDGW